MFLRYLLTVSFLRNLRAYLEARPALAREIDERALRDHILERLRELERQGEQEGGPRGAPRRMAAEAEVVRSLCFAPRLASSK
jgi:hypothetical protein